MEILFVDIISCKIVLNAYYVFCLFGEDYFYDSQKLIHWFADRNITASVQAKDGVVYKAEIAC